jgi:hypothetical protein
MGRPRKPTSLHVVQGTGRKSRMEKRSGEPKITASVGAPPEFIAGDPVTLEAWQWAAALPQVNASHRPVVEHFCVLYKRFRQDVADERVMSASERQTYHSIQMQLGATPAAQSKVSAPQEEKKATGWAQISGAKQA